VLCLGLSLPSVALAQIRASERGVSAQTVDGTNITLEYSRPQVRHRDSIFGGVVHWGEMWTPGANWATTFEVDKAIRLNGHEVPAGSYSMWFIVQPEEWTVVLDTTERLFHTNRPKDNDAQIRFAVRPETIEHQEILTFSFPAVSATGGTLAFHWATTYIPMTFEVESSREITFAEDRSAPYVGSYAWSWVSPDPEAPPQTATFEIFYQDDHLMANLDPAPFEALRRMILIEVADDWFIIGSTVDGKLFDMITDVTLEFTVEDGRAGQFELRGPTDGVMATGERTD
jgi:hypothetical protein